jgi:MoaA/NifB/PqqE/SkfB family radical SAM enzyme
MSVDDWRRVINEGAALGVRMVQFIGGEPTLHTDLPRLVEHALDRNVEVEVFSNLLKVTPQMWDTFARPGVRLATSYYADDASQHESITKRRGSYARTTANIAEAVRRSIPLRVGLIDVMDEQHIEQARQRLAALGVTNVNTDRLRQVGRGMRDGNPDISQLCGACARRKVAVAASGDV